MGPGFRVLVCVAALSAACTCDKPAPEKSATPPETSEPPCAGLPPLESWRSVSHDFFEGRIPPSFQQVEVTDGIGFRDEKRQRRLLFSKVDLPAGGMDMTTAMNLLIEGVREESSDPSLALVLGPTQRGGTDQHPVLSYVVKAKNRTFLQGFVGRDTGAGRLRAIMVLYEDEGPDASPACVEQDGRSLMAGISVTSSEVGSTASAPGASGSAPPPASAVPLRFTTAAQQELRRQLQPGETVWVGVNRDGTQLSHLIDVGKEVPSHSELLEIDGMRVAVGESSVVERHDGRLRGGPWVRVPQPERPRQVVSGSVAITLRGCVFWGSQRAPVGSGQREADRVRWDAGM